MRNDISIQGVTPVTATNEQTPESRNPRPGAPAQSAAAIPAPIYTSPSLRLDPSLGLVVIEFRNEDGAVTDSIPTQRQLRAYKQHALSETPVQPTGVAGPTGSSGTGGSRAPPALVAAASFATDRALGQLSAVGPAAEEAPPDPVVESGS